MPKKTTTQEARRIAAGYLSSATGDAEMTWFATSGQAGGWRLLECIECNTQWFSDHADQYSEHQRAAVARELDYLRTWVREHHGRYVLCVEHEVWDETDEGWDDDGTDTIEYLMFRTLSDVAAHMAKNLQADRVDDDGWTVRTIVRSDVSEYSVAGGRNGLAVPVHLAAQYTVSAAHGFTDRTWCWVILAAQAYFTRRAGR